MKGNPEIIAMLNKVLCNELTAINQYFLHAKMYKNWGFEKLGTHEYKESIEEMEHANLLIERILFLEGLPNLQDLHKLLIGENVQEMLECDLNLEKDAYVDVVQAVALSEKLNDFASRAIFTKILEDTEEHIDHLETQLELIEKIGLQNYLQSQV